MTRTAVRLAGAFLVAALAVIVMAQPASATQANRSFVYAVWMDFLGAPPTSNDLLWFETLLGNGSMSRGGVIDYVMGTSDFQEPYGYSVFEGYVDRFPTDAESTAIVSALSTGNYLEIELLAFASPDYSDSAAGTLSNTDFVTKLFGDILWRSPDPSGLSFYVNRLNTGDTRKQVANTMIRSSEAAGKRVSGLTPSPCSTTDLGSYTDIQAGSYCIVLDRPSDPSGASYWTAALSSGGSQLPALWKSLASSSEYLTHAQTRFPSV